MAVRVKPEISSNINLHPLCHFQSFTHGLVTCKSAATYIGNMDRNEQRVVKSVRWERRERLELARL